MVRSKKYRMKHNKKRHIKTMKQKLWHMKGCAKNHSHVSKRCKSCGWTSQMGGNGGCSACQLQQHGGSFYKPAAPIPGPFVGQPWTTKVDGWPGVNGVGADRNYLEYNLYHKDPQTMMIVNGGSKRRYTKGKKSKKSKRMKKGGGLIPQDLVNLGRNVSFNIGSAYNALNGYPAPVNPLPYKDQLPNNNLRSLLI
jgi:hypothetical protein